MPRVGRIDLGAQVFSERPRHAVEHRSRGQLQPAARLIQRGPRPQGPKSLAHQPDRHIHRKIFANLFLGNEKHTSTAYRVRERRFRFHRKAGARWRVFRRFHAAVAFRRDGANAFSTPMLEPDQAAAIAPWNKSPPSLVS